jgi:hypothetical protein
MGQRKTPACWPGASGALSEQLPSIDFLTTLPYVNPDRIGGMGICADGGYTVNAAINDRRIKAVGTVSAVNIGSMFRNGWDNNIKSALKVECFGSHEIMKYRINDFEGGSPLGPLLNVKKPCVRSRRSGLQPARLSSRVAH